jgi:DNA-binding GntR family transcriptional regulator
VLGAPHTVKTFDGAEQDGTHRVGMCGDGGFMKDQKNKVYHNLRFRIITNDLSPGELLNEKELLKEYRIGRSPLREVLINLQRDGLIQRFPRSGTFVTSIDLHLFAQVIEIRLTMEELTGWLAAQRITREQLDTLTQILNKVKALEGEGGDSQIIKTLTQCEFDIHDTLYEATHNQKLKEMLYELHGVCARYWYYWVATKEEVMDQFRDAEELVEALERRDGKTAGELLRHHVQTMVDRIRGKVLEPPLAVRTK